MTELRKPLTSAAKEAALWFCDPTGLVCVLWAFGESWKAGLTVSGIFLCTWIFCVWVVWLKGYDS
jgi:hypothetical protein